VVAEEFCDFTYGNIARMSLRMNPAFFNGTAVENSIKPYVA
jgi:hypothetical protein